MRKHIISLPLDHMFHSPVRQSKCFKLFVKSLEREPMFIIRSSKREQTSKRQASMPRQWFANCVAIQVYLKALYSKFTNANVFIHTVETENEESSQEKISLNKFSITNWVLVMIYTSDNTAVIVFPEKAVRSDNNRSNCSLLANPRFFLKYL